MELVRPGTDFRIVERSKTISKGSVVMVVLFLFLMKRPFADESSWNLCHEVANTRREDPGEYQETIRREADDQWQATCGEEPSGQQNRRLGLTETL